MEQIRTGREFPGGTVALRLAAGLVALSLLSGCGAVGQQIAPETSRVFIEREPEPAYEDLFPHYAQLCAISQLIPLEGPKGGVPGHAVLYLKGVCRDTEAAYPRLKMCEEGAGAGDDLNHGAAVSVNRWTKNVNWIAVPGKEFFFRGDLGEDDRLDEEHRQAVLRKAIDLGLYRGVELHEYPTDAEERSLEDFVLNRSLGTDFALNFGRTVSCSRVPVTEEMMARMVWFLNDLNKKYAEGTDDYNWSGFSDNCAHLVHNALAAAKVWKPEAVHTTKLKQIFNLSVPENEFVRLAEHTTEYHIEDFTLVSGDKTARTALEELGWLPARHGALLETYHVHQWNDLYNTDYRLFTLEGPLRHSMTKKAQVLLNDARFVELESNLIYFEKRYRTILDKKEEAMAAAAGVKDDALHTLLDDYYRYMELQLEDVTEKLERLRTGHRSKSLR